ncbi:MAG: phytanoyl-CoA dioxygenase family protein [Chloroflexota bacterium]|nr:phytanoyl-CoA dioxygenase family protein [Chloroflexota bacterium]
MPGLSAAQRQQFEEEGYLVVEDVLDPREDLQPVFDEYDRVLDGIAASLLAEGAIRSAYKGLPFVDRLVAICAESGRNFPQHFDISLPQKGVKYDTPMHHGPAVFNVLTNPKLLDVVESLVGPEIYSNPVQHIRTKLPARAVAKGKRNGLITAVDWHQDNGVVLPEADEATILTVWLPLTEATLDNGCMRVIPRSHRGGLADHCPTSDRGPTIPYSLLDLDRAVELPMRAGSILLMTQRTVHSSLENTTEDQVRISLDLRYQPVGQPTGRPAFPGFVARSASRPETVLRDPATWAQMWLTARERLARAEDPTFNRWRADAPVCA